MNASPNGWRQMGQEKFLTGSRLTCKNYQALSAQWKHEHCVLYFRTFLDPGYSSSSSDLLAAKPEENRSAGYTNLESSQLPAGQHWICEQCFDDFGEELGWTVEKTDPDAWPYHGPEPDQRPTSADCRRPEERLQRRPE
jgi:hypothetical protein